MRKQHVVTLLISVPGRWSKQGTDFEMGAPGIFVIKKWGVEQYVVANCAMRY